MASQSTDTVKSFAELQRKVLAEHRVNASVRLLDPDSETPINVIETGQGDPLLFVHGGGGIAANWARLFHQLQDDYRCLAVDRPGHGLSYRVDYRRVLDFRADAVAFIERSLDLLQVERGTLVGNSMGGFFCIAYALAKPERVDHLILLGAPAGIDRSVPLMLRLLGTPVVGALLWKTIARPTEGSLRKLHERLLVANADQVGDTDIACLLASHRRPGTDVAWLSLLGRFLDLRGVSDACYLRDELPALEVPTLFAWGDQDAFAPPTSGEQACRVMKNAHLEVIPGAGHQPWTDAPEACADKVRRFLSRRPVTHAA